MSRPPSAAHAVDGAYDGGGTPLFLGRTKEKRCPLPSQSRSTASSSRHSTPPTSRGCCRSTSPDATLVPQPDVVVEGIDGIRDALRWFLDRKGRITIDSQLVLRVDDLAYLSNRWSLTGGTMPDGSRGRSRRHHRRGRPKTGRRHLAVRDRQRLGRPGHDRLTRAHPPLRCRLGWAAKAIRTMQHDRRTSQEVCACRARPAATRSSTSSSAEPPRLRRP